MTSQIEEQTTGSAKDTVFLVASALILIGAVVAFSYFETLAVALRVLLLLGAIGAALALAYQTTTGRAVWDVMQGSRVELRKTTWPTRQEGLQTTLMIAVVVLIASLMLWGLDSLLLWAVKLLTGRA